MLSRVLRPFRYYFGRKKQSIDPQQLQQAQKMILEKYYDKYKFPDEFKHQDILYEQELYGNKCDISGITENNLESCKFTKDAIGLIKPKTIILGGFNQTQAISFLQQPLPYLYGYSNENLKPAKLYCKSSLLPMLQKKLDQDENLFFDQKQRILWKTQHFSRSLIVNDYINATFQSMYLDSKLIYGKPPSIFIYQDLMLTFELQELQNIFQKTLQKVDQSDPTSNRFTGFNILEHVKIHALIQFPQLYSKQVTYTTALLNRLTKIGSKNLLLIQKEFVKRISENVHNIDFEPQKVYRNWIDDERSENFQKMRQIVEMKKRKQILQKFALLSILKGYHLEVHVIEGKNIFKDSIFHDLFEGMTAEQILAQYTPLKRIYMEKFFDLQRRRIKNNIAHHPPQTQFMYLKDQLRVVDQRKQAFQPYEAFAPKNFVTQTQDSIKLRSLQQKLKEIVEDQCDQYQKQLYSQFKKGSATKEGIILYSKLLGKANVQLGPNNRVKLPYFHFNAFRGFYKDYMKDHILYDRQKKKRKLEARKMRKIQSRLQGVVKQIQDPHILRKYIAGEMGQAREINMIQGANGQVDMDGDLEDLQKVLDKIGNSAMKQEFQEFKKKNSVQNNQNQGQWDSEDFQDQEIK